jgi:transcriptional regulator with XRE-family HTH domain
MKKELDVKDLCKQITNYTGNLIRLIRRDHHVEIKNIAKELGVSIQQFRKYEMGENRICIARLLLILNHLKYDIHTFIVDLMKIHDISYMPIQKKPAFKNVEKLNSDQYKLIEKLIKNLTKNN